MAGHYPAIEGRSSSESSILVNMFVNHKETRMLESAPVPVIRVRLGYGVTAVKTALEDYFGRQAAN